MCLQARVRTEQLLVRLRAHPGAHVCVSVLPGWFSVFVGCAVSLPACCVSKGSQEVGMSEVTWSSYKAAQSPACSRGCSLGKGTASILSAFRLLS